MRQSKELLTGNPRLLDYLQQQYQVDDHPHPMQDIVEDAISELDDDLKEVFYMRYGQHMSIRRIAREQGYNSHQVIQIKLGRIKQKVRSAVADSTNVESATDSSEGEGTH